MKNLWIYGCLFASVLVLSACIENDIPYPYIKGEIAAFEVEGQTGEAEINKNNRTIVVSVGDEVDIEELRITKFVVNDEATFNTEEQYCVSPAKFPSTGFSSLADLPAGADTRVDFTKTVPFLLRTYQDYQWMITVNQTIERSVEVENQALPAIIDDKNHTVLVYVSQKQDLSAVKILKMNLGGSQATVYPDPSIVTNFRRPQTFTVVRFDKITLWTVDVVRTASTGTTGSVDVWATRATLNGGMKQGTTPRVEYRKKTEETWTAVPEADVKLESTTTFSTVLTGLEDGTNYVWRVVVDDIPSTEDEFTTEKIQEIPNLNFDTWSQNPTGSFKKSWYPNADGSNSFWATGNDGVTSSPVSYTHLTLPTT